MCIYECMYRHVFFLCVCVYLGCELSFFSGYRWTVCTYLHGRGWGVLELAHTNLGRSVAHIYSNSV